MNHPWFSGKEQKENLQDATKEALKNFKHFWAEAKLQQATLSFIVNQMTSKEEISELEKVFKKLDTNSDGKLSKDELLAGYSKVMGDMAESEVDRIMELADTDGSGTIEFSEWLVVSINLNKLLTEEKFKAAFELFDLDHSGRIKAEEL